MQCCASQPRQCRSRMWPSPTLAAPPARHTAGLRDDFKSRLVWLRMERDTRGDMQDTRTRRARQCYNKLVGRCILRILMIVSRGRTTMGWRLSYFRAHPQALLRIASRLKDLTASLQSKNRPLSITSRQKGGGGGIQWYLRALVRADGF